MNIENRKFKMWYYTISLSQLLLRSEGEKNIDIYFADVIYIELPTVMNNIEIKETTEEDEEYIRKKIGELKYSKEITVLTCDSKKYYVVSGVPMRIFENRLSAFELPFFITYDMASMYTTIYEK